MFADNEASCHVQCSFSCQFVAHFMSFRLFFCLVPAEKLHGNDFHLKIVSAVESWDLLRLFRFSRHKRLSQDW